MWFLESLCLNSSVGWTWTVVFPFSGLHVRYLLLHLTFALKSISNFAFFSENSQQQFFVRYTCLLSIQLLFIPSKLELKQNQIVFTHRSNGVRSVVKYHIVCTSYRMSISCTFEHLKCTRIYTVKNWENEINPKIPKRP